MCVPTKGGPVWPDRPAIPIASSSLHPHCVIRAPWSRHLVAGAVDAQRDSMKEGATSGQARRPQDVPPASVHTVECDAKLNDDEDQEVLDWEGGVGTPPFVLG